MTLLTISPISSPTLTNLTGSPVGGSIVALRWTIPQDTTHFQTEIWVNTVNNRATATLAEKSFGSTYAYVGTPGTTYYFWIRSVNIYGYTAGAWTPVSATGGVAVTLSRLITDNISDNAITDEFVYTSSVAKTIPSAFSGGASVILADLTYQASGGRVRVRVEDDLSPTVGILNGVNATANTNNITYYNFYMSRLTVYNVGTATFTNGSAAVTGQGTAWTAALQGKIIGLDEGTSNNVVGTVNSPTSLTLALPWANPSVTASAYYIQLTHTNVYGAETPESSMFVFSGNANCRFVYGNRYRREFDLTTTLGDFYEIQLSARMVAILNNTQDTTPASSLRRKLTITEFYK